MHYFESKKIVITGASKGIGKALAIELSSRGADLFLLSRDIEKLETLCGLIKGNGGNAACDSCDVSCREEMLESAKKVKSYFNKIDILFLNAGVGGANYFSCFDAEKIRKIFDVNFFGIIYGLEAFIPIMLNRGEGLIAGVGSLAEPRGLPGSSAYSASKIAVSHILEAARIELKKKNIKIVSIKPGFVATDMTAQNHFAMPFLISPEKAAKIIADGLEKGKLRISFPWQTALFSYIGKTVPGFFFEYVLSFWYKSLAGD